MTSIYPDSSEIYNSTEEYKKHPEELKGITKKLNDLKGFSYLSYLIKKSGLTKFFNNADGITLFATPNKFLINKGEDYFIRMSMEKARRLLLNHVVDKLITPDNFPTQHYFNIGSKSSKDLFIHNLVINDNAKILTSQDPTIVDGNIVYVVDNLL